MHHSCTEAMKEFYFFRAAGTNRCQVWQSQRHQKTLGRSDIVAVSGDEEAAQPAGVAEPISASQNEDRSSDDDESQDCNLALPPWL